MSITTDDIPPEALEAGKDTAFAWLRSHMEDDVRVREMTDEELTELVSAACLTMLKAWHTDRHKMVVGKAMNEVGGIYPAIILPLTETDDEPR